MLKHPLWAAMATALSLACAGAAGAQPDPPQPSPDYLVVRSQGDATGFRPCWAKALGA